MGFLTKLVLLAIAADEFRTGGGFGLGVCRLSHGCRGRRLCLWCTAGARGSGGRRRIRNCFVHNSSFVFDLWPVYAADDPLASGVPAPFCRSVSDLFKTIYDVKRGKVPKERFGPKSRVRANSARVNREMCREPLKHETLPWINTDGDG